MLCRFCGKQIADDAEYCSYCGRKVLRVPPVFTMTNIGTGVATDAIRNYSEWGFYNNPDAELDPETGQKRETEFDTLKTLPEENPVPREGEEVLCEILLLDPSGIMERMLAPGRSSVLFSATLTPMEYFRDVTGMKDASVLELPSPYEQENLCLVACDGAPLAGVAVSSVFGAVLHNTGQILAALVILQTPQIIAYYPFLIVSGCLAGFFTGLCAQLVVKRLN